MNPFSPKFIYGFEFEGVVLFSDYNEFCRGLREIHPKMTIDEDSSIRKIPEGYVAIEFSTQKASKKSAFKVLDEILSYLWLMSQDGIFLTNSTCGFHVNMSEEKIFQFGKQLEYYSNIVWNFEENKFLKLFKRQRSTYCRPFKTTNRCNDVNDVFKKIKHLDSIANNIPYYERIPANKKYYAIALRENPEKLDEKNTRIEFRFMGNKDYHLRQKDLTDSLSHIITVAETSLVPI